MTNAAAMTYDSLVTDISGYTERRDQAFLDQIPRFIMLAENRIASECRGLGFQRYATFTLNSNIIDKPSRWRETISLSLVNNNEIQYLYERGYEYCRMYSPNPATTGIPVYYANYDYEHIIVVPSPASSYPSELAYYERPEPLSSLNQTSWTTQYAPQLLLYACLLETAPWLKNDQRIQTWQGLYNAAKGDLENESARRMSDRSNSRTSE